MVVTDEAISRLLWSLSNYSEDAGDGGLGLIMTPPGVKHMTEIVRTWLDSLPRDIHDYRHFLPDSDGEPG